MCTITNTEIINALILVAGIFLMAIIVADPAGFKQSIMRAIFSDAEMNLRTAYNELAQHLLTLDSSQLTEVNSKIEEFRIEQQKYVPEDIVTVYVVRLYQIHNNVKVNPSLT